MNRVTGKFRRCDARRLYMLPSKSAAIVIGSPPYLEARTYGIRSQRRMAAWLELMMACTVEGLRVSRGLVLWVVAGTTKDGNYTPGPEALIYEAWKAGIEQYRPVCWYKVDPITNGGCGIPGSGGKQWLRGDWEYIIAFKSPGPLPFANPTFEKRPPKCPPGGKMRNRQKDGSRELQTYENPKYVNPGNVLKARVGGGHMGDRIACQKNEAPYPERLPAFFIEGWTQPGDLVVDPFSGSGTTVCEAVRLGRYGLGTDLRDSQISLSRRRLQMRRRAGQGVTGEA